MAELEPVVAKFRADLSEVLEAFDTMGRRADGALRNLSAKFDAVGRRLQGFGFALSVGITAPVALFGRQAVEAASRAQELGNLIDVTFGEASRDVRAWSLATATAMNRSSTAFLQVAGDFAAFLKPLGVAPDAVVPMSKALTALTTDLSSFRNIAEQDVFTRLFSGLAGETEAVRRMGIDLGQAAIEAELLRLGFAGNAQEATQAQKVVARFNLILAQTRDAQGDAVRTSASYENQTRASAAAIRDFQERIGADLLPVMTQFHRVTSLGVRGLLAMDESSRKTAVSVALFAAALGPGLIAVGTLIRVLGFATTGLVVFGNAALAASKKVLVALARVGAALVSVPALFTAAVTAAVVFRRTLVTLFTGVGTALSLKFVNEVQRPLLMKLADLRDALGPAGAAAFAAIGLAEFTVPPEVDAAGAEFADVWKRAAEQAGRDVDAFKAVLGAGAGAARGLLPTGLVKGVRDFAGGVAAAGNEAAAAEPKLDDLFGLLEDFGTSGATELAKEDLKAIADLVKLAAEAAPIAATEFAKSRAAMDEFSTTLALTGHTFDEVADRIRETDDETKEVSDTVRDLGFTFESTFEKAAAGGERLRDVLDGILQDLIKIAVRQLVTAPLAGAVTGALSSFGFARGGAFARGRVLPFARGGVVDRPTLFPMAAGAGLAGERGPEAVLPLQRTRGGDLGVRAEVGGRSRTVVNVFAPPGSTVTQERRQRGGDLEEIRVMIDRAVGEAIERPGTATHRALRRSFGAAPTTTAR